ncbi:putative 30S ribosomal protein S16 [Streptomyces sp. Tu6071]|nr:putative 30S ribosomal protein S16 [Streptomyces sp. Tu6071]
MGPGTTTGRGRPEGPPRPAPVLCCVRWTSARVRVQRTWSTSTRSTRTPRPPMAPTTVRRARAVRPLRPITLPRSSGCTRTSRTRPRRRVRSATCTSSGLSTMPFTRCSRASSSMSALGRLGRVGLVLLVGLLRLLGDGLTLGLIAGLRRDGLEETAVVGLRLRLEQRRRGGLALELLPVAGLLQDGEHGLGRLRADTQPVRHAVGVDLDARGVLHRVVQADLLDRTAVTAGAGVGDDDAVVRRADLAQTLQLDLDCHGSGVSWS